METRRNLVTSGIALKHLMGKHFRVGGTLLYGGRLNVPCRYLEDLLDKPVFGPLVNRAGLDARVLASGVVRVGGPIVAG
ncbi:MOSC domain-containing protein [Actinosynnema sp. NPDC023658]|uniref:MOSC domain-containing protein n=1 Tax=Actinosynnema sp. NPDC023658 TaxID=3155465 RepID=UPI0033E898A9